MILVSFFPTKIDFSDETKTENSQFRLFWDTLYSWVHFEVLKTGYKRGNIISTYLSLDLSKYFLFFGGSFSPLLALRLPGVASDSDFTRLGLPGFGLFSTTFSGAGVARL